MATEFITANIGYSATRTITHIDKEGKAIVLGNVFSNRTFMPANFKTEFIKLQEKGALTSPIAQAAFNFARTAITV